MKSVWLSRCGPAFNINIQENENLHVMAMAYTEGDAVVIRNALRIKPHVFSEKKLDPRDCLVIEEKERLTIKAKVGQLNKSSKNSLVVASSLYASNLLDTARKTR